MAKEFYESSESARACSKRRYAKDPQAAMKATADWRSIESNRLRYNELQRGYMQKNKAQRILAQIAKEKKQ